MKAKVFILGLLIATFGLAFTSYAEVPKMINYQGKLTTPQGALIDTTVGMTFCIADVDGDGYLESVWWQETQDSVKVEKGVFSVLLGSVNPIPDTVFTGEVKYLGVTVGTDSMMMPLKPIVSTAYAYHSGDWTIDGDNIYRLNGKVGIATTSPQGALQVGEENGFVVLGIPEDPYVYYTGINDNNPDAKLEVSADGGGHDLLMLSSNDDEDGDRLIVKNNGFVGIDIKDPRALLNVYEDAKSLRTDFTQNVNNAGILITTDYSPGYYTPGLFWSTKYNNPAKPKAGIYLKEGSGLFDPGTFMYFGTSDNFGFGITNDAMVIDPSGNIGIGTTSPDYKLDVRSDIGIATSNESGFLTIGVTLDGPTLRFNETGALCLGSGSGYSGIVTYGEIMRLTGDHKVGIKTTSPNSTLHINGSLAKAFKSVDANYTLNDSDCVLAVNAVSADVTIDLPSAVGITGRVYTIKRYDGSPSKAGATGTLTIDPYSEQTIDGQLTYSLGNEEAVTIVSNGANWLIICKCTGTPSSK